MRNHWDSSRKGVTSHFFLARLQHGGDAFLSRAAALQIKRQKSRTKRQSFKQSKWPMKQVSHDENK